MRVGYVQLLSCLFGLVSAHSTQRAPIRTVWSVDDATLYTREGPLRYDSNLELAFTTPDGAVQLELTPNLDLLHHTQSAFVLDDDESDDGQRSEAIDGTLFHVYKGRTMRDTGVETVAVGSARIVVHDTRPLLFEGTFSVGDNMHHVQLSRDYIAMKSEDDAQYYGDNLNGMVLWSDRDLHPTLAKRDERYQAYERATESFCSSDKLNYDETGAGQTILRRDQSVNIASVFKRQLSGDTGASYVTQAQLRATIGQTNGCPLQREVAIMGAAADCNFVQLFNSSSTARASIIAAFNSASGVYETAFNISLGLGNILTTEAACPTSPNAGSPWNVACDATTTLGDRLSLFSTWRGRQDDSYAAWSLITTCNTDSEIGVAWLGTVCSANSTNQTNSVVSGANVVAASTSGGSYWRTLAHEIGHNFGADHDCTASSCGTTTPCCPLSTSTCPAGGAYLMNPSSSQSTTGFSPCTIGQVCSNMLNKKITTSCLSTNQNVRLAEGAASCGNGIVEEGEDCDCGGVAGCGNNPCCNPTTCKFNTGAVCDREISACCNDQCQFSPANTVCRPSTGQCDPAEVCSGTSGNCPVDAFATNGQSCGSGLQCASGQCTSRALQCEQQMNTTQGSCDDLQCALTCRVNNRCFIAGSNFITGTPCGNGGTCQAGVCDEGSVGHQIESWFDNNKKWLIPVVSVVGGLIVLTTLYCWISSCVARRRSPKQAPQMVYSSQNYVPTQYAQDPWQQNAWQPQVSYEAPTRPTHAYRGH